MDNYKNLNSYFTEKLEQLNCDEKVRSYIVSIFSKYKNAHGDLSKDSITIKWSDAKLNNNFEKFQEIGDWLFLTSSLFPESLNHASKDYYFSVGRLSYYSCYRIIRQWQIYELLADQFIPLSTESGKILKTRF